MLGLLVRKELKERIDKIFNEKFYVAAYKKHIKSKKPIDHFIKNYKTKRFDPSPDINLKKITLSTGLSVKEVLIRLSTDADFYNFHRTVSDRVLEKMNLDYDEDDVLKLKTCLEIVDENFYVRHNPDVKESWLTPAMHYYIHGAYEGRNPCEYFDSALYLSLYPDVSNANINPFVHYFELGKNEGRVANKVELDIQKSLQEDEERIEEAKRFDAEYYLSQFDDLNLALDESFDHYIASGESLGKQPNVHFNPIVYLRENPDVDKLGCSAFKHFCDSGWQERRVFSEVVLNKDAKDRDVNLNLSIHFDQEHYYHENPEVKKAGVDAYTHYVTVGEKQGCTPNQFFSPVFYRNLNSDIRVSGMSPFEHYRINGFFEGRLGVKPEIKDRSNKRKPLLFVGHDGIRAGSEVVLLEIVKWFYQNTNRNIQVLLLSSGELANEYAKYSDVYVLSEYSIDNTEDVKEFLDKEFEFIYLNTVVSGCLFEILENVSIHLNGPVVSHVHEMEKVINEHIGSFQYLKEKTNHFISASPASSKALINMFDIAESDLTTIPAFINVVGDSDSDIESLRKKSREELHLDKNAFVVAGCGTVYWRKAPDLFIKAAKNILSKGVEDIQFVWIGPGPDLDEIMDELTDQEKEKIKFVGSKSNANELLACADVFFMCSREDPFPLVVMEAAQHKVPSICFSEATGITDFIMDDAGICLDSIDTDLASQEIIRLKDNPQIRLSMGGVARKRVIENYTTDIQCMNIYKTILECGYYSQALTAIVPLYNHEEFVTERVSSILNQSIKDIDVLLLDDCSKDGTFEEAKKFESDFRVSLIKNKKNSGTPFSQWKKGLENCLTEIVWIAEGDDTCDFNFIETLLPYFDDPLVNIASAKTEIMDETGEVKLGLLDEYLDTAIVNKYNNSFIKDGFEEVNESFGAVCTLVNASGLLLRTSSINLDVLEQATKFKMCGDWLVYLSCLKEGKLAYDVSTNNYFRRHSESVVNKVEGTDNYFKERYKITEYVIKNYHVGKRLLRKAFEAIDGEWDRFSHKNNGKSLSDYYDKQHLSDVMIETQGNNKHIAFYVHGMLFSSGGIEKLAADIANYLVPKGYKVTIYCRVWGETSIIFPLYENVIVKPVFDEANQADSIIAMRKMLQEDVVDLFIPMLSEWLFDPIIEAAKHTGIPVIASEHNDPWKIEELWWNHDKRVECFTKVDGIHLLLDKFSESLPEELQDKITLIPNGIDIPDNVNSYESRDKLIIAVGRLAEQKRFDRLINAVSIIADDLRRNEWRVEIYGDGHLKSELSKQISSLNLSDIITLKGVTKNIGNVYNRASINVMPSEFEGFGIALVEAMSYRIPSIAYSECNGPNEIIKDGLNGYLVSSEIELSERILGLLNSDKSSQMSKSAVKEASEYDKNIVFPLWEKLVNEKV